MLNIDYIELEKEKEQAKVEIDEKEKEQQYLNNVLIKLKENIKSRENAKQDFNSYALGKDYDEIDNVQYEKRNAKRKNERIEREVESLKEHVEKPYIGKLEYLEEDKVMTCYIGSKPDDAPNIDLEYPIISWTSDIGKKYTNAMDIIRKNDQHNIILKRVINIENSKIDKIIDDYKKDYLDISYNIIDSFLKKVLINSRSNHKLTNIISSIQVNQNKIIETNFDSNIIVQGCAGSGKTVIMLHRISYLKGHMKDRLKFSDIKIITPSKDFNFHISSLTSELGVSDINLFTIEEYYHYLISNIDKNFLFTNNSTIDFNFNTLLSTNLKELSKIFYSDEFTKQFNIYYKNVFDDIFTDDDMHILYSNNFLDSIPNKTYDLNYLIKLKKIFNNSSYKSNNLENLENDIALKNINLNNMISELDKITSNETKHTNDLISILKEINKRLTKRIQTREELVSKASSYNNVHKDKLNDIYININHLKNIQNILNKICELILMNDYNSAIKHIKYINSFEPKILTDKYINTIIKRINKVQSINNEKNITIETIENLKSSINNDNIKLNELNNMKKFIYTHDKVKKNIDSLKYLTLYNKIIENIILNINKNTMLYGKFFNTYNRYSLYTRLLFLNKLYSTKSLNDKLICIDEGQNLSLNEYKLLLNINNQKAYFNIFGDSNQLLENNSGISNWNKLNKINDFNYFELNENYRNTNQITEYCNEIFNYNHEKIGIDGSDVSKISKSSISSILQTLEVSDERIAIIIPNNVSTTKYLKNSNISLNIYGSNKIQLLSVNESRGLEFDIVFVDERSMKKNEKYVAFTRALHTLYIIDRK